MSNQPGQAVEKQDKLLDFNGYAVGIPFTKKHLIAILAAVACVVIGNFLPLQQFGENCGLALGWLAAVLILMIFLDCGSRVPAAMICAVGGLLLKLWDMAAVKTALGNSSFYIMLGMTVVALGAELTPMGKRIAYWFLSKFGSKPTSIVYAFGITTALLSTFIGNIPCIIMMSGIANNILLTRGEKPGESKLGRALMMLVTAAAMIGGIALISGAPIGNNNAITMMESNCEGAYTCTYGMWASAMVPSFLVLVVPMCWIYIKCSGLKNEDDVNVRSSDYYKEMLDGMGTVGGSEIRWVVITIVMVVALCLGMDMRLGALLFACISMMPVIGFAPAKKLLPKVPLEILLPMAMLPLLGTMFNNCGVSNLISSILTPVVQGLSPLAFAMVCGLFSGICVNLFVNAGSAATAVIMAVTVPLSIALGYNPGVVLLPAMTINSLMFVLSANAQVMLNKNYGFWDDKDTILPGTLVLLLACIVIPIMAVLVCPLFGFSLYI